MIFKRKSFCIRGVQWTGENLTEIIAFIGNPYAKFTHVENRLSINGITIIDIQGIAGSYIEYIGDDKIVHPKEWIIIHPSLDGIAVVSEKVLLKYFELETNQKVY